MLRTIIHFHNSAIHALEDGVNLEEIQVLEVREQISKMKFLPEEDAKLLEVYIQIDLTFKNILKAKE
jgi:vacuolar-type H+-ATPase catalytic subunit A/Vma1